VQVWGAAGPRELLAIGDGRAYALRPRRLVLATGAYERGVPLPGWTLPGFMTTGAAQTLMRAYQVVPGRRVLVSGNGPLNIQVAAELVRAGATVVALCETARPIDPRRAAALATMAAAAPDLMRDGVGYGRALRAARVPILFGHAVVRAEGDGRVESAVVARLDPTGMPVPGSERRYVVDAVCAGFGFLPSNELARTIGVEHVFDPALGQLAAVRASDGRTSVEDVWVVGDSGGTGGARLAKAVGLLAGAAAAGAPVPPTAERDRRRNDRFQRALWQLYRAPRLVDQLADPDTPICRCENVPRRAVDEALAGGIATIGALKRVTRAGMGRCQGRYCASILAEVAARRSGLPLDERAWFAPGIPFKPLPVELIAAASEPAG
jgi:NADPH-dependent 2,4-dienoyl-CoA reductase/sulfur reductase-like enzyme